jgi:hypothetical protein
MTYATGNYNQDVSSLTNKVASLQAKVDALMSIPPQPGRNVIVNGAMAISQVNGTTTTTPATSTYPVDNVKYIGTQASKFTVTKTIDHAFLKSLGSTSCIVVALSSSYTPVSTDYFGLQIPIEGFYFSRFQFGTEYAKNWSLQFKARATVAGIYCVVIRNDAATRCYPLTFKLEAQQDTLVKFENLPGDTGGSWVGNTKYLAASLWFELGSGKNYELNADGWATSGSGTLRVSKAVTMVSGTVGDSLAIADVQLEVGPVCTPFERKFIDQDLIECQRYLPVWRSDKIGIMPASLYGTAVSTSAGLVILQTPVPTRVPITGMAYLSSSISVSDSIALGSTAVSTLAFDSGTTSLLTLTWGIASTGATVGRPTFLQFTSATNLIYGVGAQL